jgi:hypothetical protein
MLKKTFTLTFLIVAVFILPCLNRAVADSDVYVSPFFAVVAPNELIQFTAKPIGGTPPFTYQWYYTFLDANLVPEDYVRVAVSGAINETFQFSASKLGRYGISIGWQDGDGYTGYQSFQPMGIVVTVTNTSTSTPSPTLTPTATPMPTQSQVNHTVDSPHQIPTGAIIVSIIAIAVVSAVAITILTRKRKPACNKIVFYHSTICGVCIRDSFKDKLKRFISHNFLFTFLFYS